MELHESQVKDKYLSLSKRKIDSISFYGIFFDGHLFVIAVYERIIISILTLCSFIALDAQEDEKVFQFIVDKHGSIGQIETKNDAGQEHGNLQCSVGQVKACKMQPISFTIPAQ
jgi:hypothetical protein